MLSGLVQHRQAGGNATARKSPSGRCERISPAGLRGAASSTKEERMEPFTVAASVVLVLVLVIFAAISIFGLMRLPPND